MKNEKKKKKKKKRKKLRFFNISSGQCYILNFAKI